MVWAVIGFTFTRNYVRDNLIKTNQLGYGPTENQAKIHYTFIVHNNNNNNNNHGSTALYGLGPPLSEVTKSCAFVAVGDWTTGRATILSILMCPPSGRQSGDLGEKWRL
jgi:hypothetical protein